MARRAFAALVVVVATTLAACSTGAPSGDLQQNYVSGDGTITEFPEGSRGEPIVFSGTTDAGGELTSVDLSGSVVVVNFWYATCPPCRLEAPWLEELYQKYSSDGVEFVGVNVRDDAETSRAFAETFDVTYPSIVDRDSSVVLAFSGIASPSAVPTTLVLDRAGRPASRIVGLIDKSILDELIQTALAEPER